MEPPLGNAERMKALLSAVLTGNVDAIHRFTRADIDLCCANGDFPMRAAINCKFRGSSYPLYEVLAALKAIGGDVNTAAVSTTFRGMQSPLLYDAIRNPAVPPAVIRWLVTNGADVNAPFMVNFENSSYPLHAAVSTFRDDAAALEVVQILLAVPGVRLYERNSGLLTPLALARRERCPPELLSALEAAEAATCLVCNAHPCACETA